jgi:hypothetical protein
MIRAYERGVQPVHRSGDRRARRTRESLKAPIALAIDVLFRFFHFLGGYFQLFLVYLEKVKFT